MTIKQVYSRDYPPYWKFITTVDNFGMSISLIMDQVFQKCIFQGSKLELTFTLKDFKFVDGHVGKIKKTKRYHADGAIKRDFDTFIRHVKDILCSDNKKLISEYPPYLKCLELFLNKLDVA